MSKKQTTAPENSGQNQPLQLSLLAYSVRDIAVAMHNASQNDFYFQDEVAYKIESFATELQNCATLLRSMKQDDVQM